MKRLILHALAALFASSAFAVSSVKASERGQAPPPGSIREIVLGTSYPGVDELPIYIADEQGYFKKRGIKVKIVSLATGDKIIYALMGGSIDIARYTSDWIVRAVERGGSDLKIVLGASNNLVFSLIVQNAVHDYSDLRGKRIGVSTISAADATLTKKMMAAHGMKAGDYILIPSGSSPERSAALRAGSLAAAILSPPSDEMVLQSGGFKRLDVSTNILKHYAWGGQAVRGDWAKAHRDELVDYIHAWIEGDIWLHDPSHKEAVVHMLSDKAHIDPRFAAAEYDLYFGPEALLPPADGQIDVAGYQALIGDMAAAGQFSGPKPPASKFLDSEYWQEARKGSP